jgi:hypothetical protein
MTVVDDTDEEVESITTQPVLTTQNDIGEREDQRMEQDMNAFDNLSQENDQKGGKSMRDTIQTSEHGTP